MYKQLFITENEKIFKIAILSFFGVEHQL